MQVVDRNRFSAFWRLGWQLDDNHQLTLGQLYDVSAVMASSGTWSTACRCLAEILNLWLTGAARPTWPPMGQTRACGLGVTLERSWRWEQWRLGTEFGAKQWLIKEHDWQPMINLTLSYHFSW